MATPKKRSSTGFTTNPPEEATEEKEVEEFLDAMAVETFAEIENQEEVKEEPKVEAIREIVPTEDPGPRFVEQPVTAAEPPAKPVKPEQPRRHPRNIPRFTRVVK
jgi:hypothetical protein